MCMGSENNLDDVERAGSPSENPTRTTKTVSNRVPGARLSQNSRSLPDVARNGLFDQASLGKHTRALAVSALAQPPIYQRIPIYIRRSGPEEFSLLLGGHGCFSSVVSVARVLSTDLENSIDSSNSRVCE